jgi:protein-export membrane protein SecD
MSTHFRWLIFIVILSIFCIYVALPADIKGVTPDDPVCERLREDPELFDLGVRCNENIRLDLNNDRVPELDIAINQRFGLDLVGGLRVLLQADLDTSTFELTTLRTNMQETANNIGRRVNGLGLTEASVQTQGSDRILVELPGVRNRQQAIDTIRQTALLEFVDFASVAGQSQNYDGQLILTTRQLELHNQRTGGEEDSNIFQRQTDPTTGQPFRTVFTGEILDRASAQFAPLQQGAQPVWHLAFQIKPEFATAFGEYTSASVGQPMAIVLDGEVLSAPVIQATLTDSGVITGNFDEESSQRLALQLQSGALPIPLRVVSAEEVGATLGQTSVALSVRAGIIGVIVVLAFMLIYYRVPGIAAALALLVFIIINLALFKLVPVTLTLPAITGFLISIGTAVDGNILIFERIKEELRAGKSLDAALDAGFNRAWITIRDSNLSTIIIGSILFFFGQTPGASIVSGFAITLILGLFVNIFTAVFVTRTFLYVLVRLGRNPITNNKWLLGV